MPWKVLRNGDEFLVVNDKTGDLKGRHRSREKAEAQLRALYANVPEASGPGKAKRGSMNPPYQFGGSAGTKVERGGT